MVDSRIMTVHMMPTNAYVSGSLMMSRTVLPAWSKGMKTKIDSIDPPKSVTAIGTFSDVTMSTRARSATRPTKYQTGARPRYGIMGAFQVPGQGR